ncbi:MAG: HYR domain-containing protein [Proteobacteria bacterium]|jgi:hypothetical protein|nr:HYR domain-containing protein [Pseudomonadota bacterium]
MMRLVGTLIAAFALAACSDDSPGFVAGGECAEGLLECAPDLEAECSAPLSDVEVAAPTPCDGTVTITDDAPADGYPVGETAVTFTATDGDATESCTTTVTVLDETPPEIECAPDVIAVRTSPEDPAIAAPAPLSANDACDAEVDVTASPAEVPYGTTEVEYTATDDAGLTATCTTQVTVLDGFAVAGLRVLSASLGAGDTTSVTIGWEPAGGDATGYRIDRAADPDGPFSAVGTVAADAAVFTDPSTADPHNYYRIVTLVGDLEGGATELIHAYAIAAAGYDLDSQSVPGVSFLTTLYGVVRHPVDLAAGPYPLVVMLHGNHGNCRQNSTTDDYCQTRNGQDCTWGGFTTTPNAEGMLFQVETLAAQGYVAVTISGNALNCRDDYIPQRAQLMIEHLRRWKSWSEASADPFGAQFVGAVDMNRVGLVGHSRGGDAASSVPLALEATPVAGVTVASIFAIAPTDYHATTPVGTDYAVLLPACDGDVSTLWGMDIYDRGLDPDDHVVRSQVLFVGANHNFFSTEWTYDDGSTECSGSELVGGAAQRGMLEATLGAWFNGTLVGGPLDPFLRAEGPTPTSIDAWAGEELDLRWSHAAEERTLVDEFEGAGTPDTNLLGGPNAFTGFTEDGRCYETGCGSAFIHHKGAAYLTWDYDATASASFDLGGLDASASSYLSFRVVSRTHAWNNGLAEQNFGARLRDGDGDAAEIEVADVQPIPHLYGADDVREVLQTVRIPLADLVAANPELDVAALASFELFFSVDGGRGAILVTDVELAEADE